MCTLDHSKLNEVLSNFSKRKRLAFALLMSERILPSLLHFSKQTSFDISPYLQARQLAWNALESADFKIDRSFINRCATNAPDTETFPGELVSHALNAALSIVSILELIADERTEHVVEIAELGRDSIDLFLQDREPNLISSSEMDDRISTDTMMDRECERRKGDIIFLSKLSENFDDQDLLKLRARANEQQALLP
jgi:uncharacterized protein YjaG (DUF416 family)